MEIILSKIMQYLPMVTAFAAPSGIVGSILKWIGGLGGGIVAIALVVSLIKDGIGIAKGSGDSSVLKIAGKVIFLIAIIGLIGVAMNYDSISTTASTIGSEAIDVVDTEIGNAFGGGGGGGAAAPAAG